MSQNRSLKPSSKLKLTSLFAARSTALSAAIVATIAFASNANAASGGGHYLESAPPKGPAQWYQGRTPIDLSHGLPFNNGTFGLPNTAYERWANVEVVKPGLSTLTYPYTDKAAFVSALEESQTFLRAAATNWKNVTEEYSKPEGKQFAQTAVQTIEPMIEKLAEAISKVKGANTDDWENAQSEARRALIEARGAYAQLHKNTSGF